MSLSILYSTMMESIQRHVWMVLYGKGCGPWIYLQRLEVLFGELIQISSLLERTYIGEGWRWSHVASFVANSQSLPHICYGNARLQETCGPCQGGKSRNAAMRCRIFSSFFRQMMDKLSTLELEQWAVTVWAIWNARNKFYFEKVQSQHRTICKELLVFWRNISRSQLHSVAIENILLAFWKVLLVFWGSIKVLWQHREAFNGAFILA